MKISDGLKFKIKSFFYLPLFQRISPFLSSQTIESCRGMLTLDHEILRRNGLEPSLENPVSQLCTASQFRSPLYRRWCKKIRQYPRLHRKQWEYAYILQVLSVNGMLEEGKKGLGFGCGTESLPSLMASYGCEILATDQEQEKAIGRGWTKTKEHSSKLEDLYFGNIVNRKVFSKNVHFRTADMNEIPQDLQEFDFVWSACAFEHLGSIEKGLDFVLNSAWCLKPGGIAVHTTEFNLGSNEGTFESEGLVLFRKRDIEELIKRCEKEGFEVSPLNLTLSERIEDGFVDLPPYRSYPHLKLAVHGYLATSIGIIIKWLK